MKHPTMRHLITLGSAAALAVGLAGGIANAAPARSVGPAHLVLRLSDVPKNFVLVSAKSLTAGQAASGHGMTGAQMRTAGYVGGFASTYEKRGIAQATKASQLNGLDIAASVVLEFRQAGGAHTAYGELVQAIPKSSDFRGARVMSNFPTVGSESRGFTYTQAMSSVSLTADFLAFRQGRFVSLVIGAGRSMTLGREDSIVSNLAKIVDGRIVVVK